MKPLEIIIGCESSQEVTKAFRAMGHNAYSCDLLPCYGGRPEWHIQDDIFNVLKKRTFDFGGFHPPCTFLSNSGVCHLYTNTLRWKDLIEGAVFFRRLYEVDMPLYIENPIQHKYARSIIGIAPTQIIQPWMFGHPESKATCLWLKGLPELVPTHNVYEQMRALPKNQQQRLHYLPPSADRWKIRSATFSGIAQAMAEQWGALELQQTA
jgi:hypothetical protein